MPDEPEALGLLALMLLHDARREARVGPNGELVLLDDQDRSRWDHARIVEGQALLERAFRMRRVGRYQLEASIAALHDEAATPAATDWPQIAMLYGELAKRAPSAVVELNRAVAVAMASGAESGLQLIEDLAASGQLEDYPYLHAARADLLRRLHRPAEAAAAYARARQLTANAAEQAFLDRRIEEVASSGGASDR
jgi:RNA polymerase sigma-70 factor, ECF subfamily